MARRVPLMIFPVLTAVIAVVYLVEDRHYQLGTIVSPGRGLYPLLVGLVALGASLACALEAARGRGQEGVSSDWPAGQGLLRVLVVLAVSFAYVWLLPYLGDTILSGLTILVVLLVMGMSPRWMAPVLALAMGLAFHYIFSVLLFVPLPSGVLFRWR